MQAIEFMTHEIEESAFGYHERYRIEQDVVVGVNKFVEDSPEVTDILRVDPESEHQQLERLKAFKADRDASLVERRLEEVRECARGHRQPAPGAAPGAQGPLLDGRGLRGDARRVRRLPAVVLSVTVLATPAVAFADFVLAIHILAVVIGFGATFAYPLIFAAARRGRSQRDAVAVVDSSSGSIATSSTRGWPSCWWPASTWPADEHQLGAFFVQWGIGAVVVIGAVSART